jgi:hypothetical protein
MSLHKVVYKGLSDIREMSAKDLKEAGVSVGADLVWDKTRTGARPKVFIADMTDRLLEIFRLEGTFTVTEVDEQTMLEVGGEPIVAGEPLDDTGSIVRDGVSGQETRKGESDPNADPVPGPGVTGASGSAGGSTGRGSSTSGGSTKAGGSGKGRSTSGNG